MANAEKRRAKPSQAEPPPAKPGEANLYTDKDIDTDKGIDTDKDRGTDKDIDITTAPPKPPSGDSAPAVVPSNFLKNHPDSLQAVIDEAAKCGIPITEDQAKEWYDHYSRWTDEEGYWVDQHDRRYKNWRRLVGGKWLQKWREEYEKEKQREAAMKREEELQRQYEEEEKERQRQRELNGEKEPQEQYSDDEPPF